MFTVEVAKLRIGIDNKYQWVQKQCADYIVDDSQVDFTVSVTEDEIARESSVSTRPFSDAYCESVCIYRKICHMLPQYNAFLLHAAVVECDGESYAFVAPSGTGKSTHASLWCKCFGDRARIINGDKPIIRFFDDGKVWVYGTPWCGKEGYNINTSSPLKSVCFINRGEDNYITSFAGSEMVSRLITQVLIPEDVANIIRLTALLDRLVKAVPCYMLTCNMDLSAAIVAYEGMQ